MGFRRLRVASAIAKWIIFLSALIARCQVSNGWNCDDGRPIQDGWRCDDMIDCKDGSDEAPENCVHKVCADDQFRCNNSRCIDSGFVCNGEADCLFGDSSDEDNCTFDGDLDGCKEYKCADGSSCIVTAWLCDGERDCRDGSDEWDCPCNKGTYGCYVRGVALCLKNLTRCDGVNHCDWGEDEKNCDYTAKPNLESICAEDRYRCRTISQCVLWKLVCDGINDCADGSDEGGLCHVKDCGKESNSARKKGGKCEQKCHDTPDGAMCSCKSGFRLSNDGYSCVDVDECGEMLSAELHNAKKMSSIYDYGINQVCSQSCVNLIGSFKCVCAKGYEVDADGYYCKASGAAVPELYLGVDNEIRGVSLRDPGGKSFFYDVVYKSNDAEETFLDIDYYDGGQLLVWTEDKSGLLMMKDDDEHDAVKVELEFRPRAVAVDWCGLNVFVTTWGTEKDNSGQARNPTIKLIAMDALVKVKTSGSANPPVANVITAGLVRPVSIALHPAKGLMVVADQGDLPSVGAKILLADMDGSNVRNLVSENLLVPYDVVVDDVQDAVIWSSAGGKDGAEVESIRLDGTQRGTIMSRKVNRFPVEPVSLALFESHIFVSDKFAREIRSWKISDLSLYGPLNTMYGSKSAVKLGRSTKLRAITIAHPVLQRPVKEGHLCKIARCSYACVLVPASVLQIKQLALPVELKAQCLCPGIDQLAKDLRRCTEQEYVHEVSSNTPSYAMEVKTTAKKIATDTGTIASATSVSMTDAATTESIAAIPVPTCQSPGSIKHASTVPDNLAAYSRFQVGTLLRLSCLDGYSPDGDFKRLSETVKMACLPDGKWNVLPPECLPVLHPRPPKKLASKIDQGIVSHEVGQPMMNRTSQKLAKKLPDEQELARPAVNKASKKLPKKLPDEVGRETVAQPTPTPKTSEADSCASHECGPWSACKKGASGDYSCKCVYGSPAINTEECPPPDQLKINPTKSRLGAANVPSVERPPSVTDGRLVSALVAMAVVLFFVLSFIAYRCLRKKRYTVDLRYFRGKSSAKDGKRRSKLVKEVPSSAGKSTSITNPNYTSPGQRRRLPKPGIGDDVSFLNDTDSGFHRSIASESISSASDGSEGTSDTRTPAHVSPLLGDQVLDEDEISMGEVIIEGAGLESSRSAAFGKRISNIFKMRKTESQECMLPKRQKKTGKIRRLVPT